MIAQKLKTRYRDRVVLWGYEEKYFDRYISKVEMSEIRLKKLEKLTLLELQGIKERLLKEKRAVYQEAMMEEYRIGAEGLP